MPGAEPPHSSSDRHAAGVSHPNPRFFDFLARRRRGEGGLAASEVNARLALLDRPARLSWVKAADLRPGDILVDAEGRTSTFLMRGHRKRAGRRTGP